MSCPASLTLCCPPPLPRTAALDESGDEADDVPEGAVRFELDAAEVEAALAEDGLEVEAREEVDVPDDLLGDDDVAAIVADAIDAGLVQKHLYTANYPDPDLLIRTSGEMRLSNFLTWQLSYTEIYVTKTFWPDFRKADLFEAVEEYGNRHRRYGGL